MSRRVAIVTDSTASIPRKYADRLGITVVQMELKVGEEYNDERQVPQQVLAEAMRNDVAVSTAPPPPPAFFWNYTDAASAGVEAIVSVHLSESLSQTCDSARRAAAELDIPVYVVDSRLCGLGLGYPVIAAAEAADNGASVQEVLAVLDHRLRRTTQMMYVDTLEYLRRGGRVTKLQALFGQTLSVKPVLIFKDGELQPLLKAMGPQRTLRKALASAISRAGEGPVDIAVEHFDFFDEAETLVAKLRNALPRSNRVFLEETSAVIGAHSGPRALGITVSPH